MLADCCLLLLLLDESWNHLVMMLKVLANC